MALFGSAQTQMSGEIDILRHDVGIFKNLIKERQHPLDLVRELLSNAAAREVGARRIEVCYAHTVYGHVFQVADDGCGMDFDANDGQVGRLARFLGLGLSGIVGEQADEFSWKGLGSKLAYQSEQVVIKTRSLEHPMYEVRLDKPWRTLDRNEVPRPRVIEHTEAEFLTGTRIKVVGHPPHWQDEPCTFDEVKEFLMHRTFAGFTRPRQLLPEIVISVGGRVEQLPVGFPEFRGVVFPDGLQFDAATKTLLVNLALTEGGMAVRLKGLLTWEPERFALAKDRLNTGLILSSRGIPFFELPMSRYGARKLLKSPGAARTCLVAECDEIYSEMNLSRSALLDSAPALTFKARMTRLLEFLETSIEYDEFRRLQADTKRQVRAAKIAEDRMSLTSEEQNWVVLERGGEAPIVLMREPRNETEAAAILWKLESLGALPFEKFQTVGHPAASRDADLFVNFQEGKDTAPLSIAMFETENRFFSYKPKGGAVPNVICWDAPARGRRVRLNKTDKPYKFTVDAEQACVPIYVMKQMDGLSLMSTRELRARGINI